MEWYTIVIVGLIVLLIFLLGILLAFLLSGKRCTISIQQRRPNQELTKMKQEQEEKEQKKLSSKMKRAFGSSSKVEQPVEPIQDVKTLEFSFQLGSNDKQNQQITTINEKLDEPLERKRLTQKERDERLKRREEIRQKYKL